MRALAFVFVLGCVTVQRRVPAGDGGPGEDAAACPGAPEEAPAPLSPWNGATTDAVVRPRFRWRSVELAGGATPTYEIQVDDTCAVGEHATCELSSPEASAAGVEGMEWTPTEDLPTGTEVPVGRRYVWRVRGCDPCSAACGPWSLGRYVDVGRAAGDVNGDGHPDLVVGAYGTDSTDTLHANAGGFTLFLGGSELLSPSVRWFAPPTVQTGALAAFAVAMAGDLDADGYGDVAVGAHSLDAPEGDEGFVWVYFGSEEGFRETRSIDNPRDGAGSSFGVTVAGAGDVDADGYADLVVGADAQAIDLDGEGAAYLYRGGPAGVAAWPSLEVRSPNAQASGIFARTVAGVGDVDGDGRSDVVVGAQWEDDVAVDQGAAYFFSGMDGLRGGGTALVDPAPEESGDFGIAVAGAGDVDGDGYGDVLVGAFLADGEVGAEDEGVAYFFRGGPGGPADPPVVLENPQSTGPGQFGYALGGAGDVDGDGYGDVLVGAPQNLPGGIAAEGETFLYRGGAGGLDLAAVTSLTRPVESTGLGFGTAVAGPGDLDGDGDDDVVVGSPGFDGTLADQGCAHVYDGDPAGLGAPVEELTSGDPEAAALFGSAIAQIGGG